MQKNIFKKSCVHRFKYRNIQQGVQYKVVPSVFSFIMNGTFYTHLWSLNDAKKQTSLRCTGCGYLSHYRPLPAMALNSIFILISWKKYVQRLTSDYKYS